MKIIRLSTSMMKSSISLMKSSMPMKTEKDLPEGYSFDISENNNFINIKLVAKKDDFFHKEEKRLTVIYRSIVDSFYEKVDEHREQNINGNENDYKMIKKYHEEFREELGRMYESFQKELRQITDFRNELYDKYESGFGFIHLTRVQENPEIWHTSSKAQHGWGPLLYDKAFEIITDRGGYLISHQEAVDRGLIEGYRTTRYTSEDAQNIWNYYRDKRDDIELTEHGYRMKGTPVREEEDEFSFASSLNWYKVSRVSLR